MSYVKLNHADATDERWIEAGADAFALHFAAIVWCDQQLKDGRISRAMASRVSLAVPPGRTDAAIDALVAAGFWREVDTGLEIVDFHTHAFPAEQVQRTRERWNTDKARRRQHAIGDHALCKDPKFCPALSTVDSTVDSQGGSRPLDKTRPDSTRPDQTGGLGLGLGRGGAPDAAPGPAGAGRSRASGAGKKGTTARPTKAPPAAEARGEFQEAHEVLLAALRHNEPETEWVVRERHGHAWKDDGSGLSCKTCGLPQPHLFHHPNTSANSIQTALA
jgi:hypothetical protein